MLLALQAHASPWALLRSGTRRSLHAEVVEALTRLRLADRGDDLAGELSLILVQQHVELALRVAEHAYVMDRGMIALRGSAHEVRHHADLVRYLAP